MKTTKPEIEKFFDDGNDYLKSKEYHKAIKIYKKILQIDPHCNEAFNNLGLAYCELGKYQDAVKTYEKVTDKQAKTFHNIGIANYYLGCYQDAVSAFKECIRAGKSKKEDEVIVAQAYYDLGVLYFDFGDMKNANEKLDGALKNTETKAAALGLKGRIEIENNNLEQATAYVSEAISASASLDIKEKLMLQFWAAYIRYLNTEFTKDLPREDSQKETLSIIRQLERIVDLSSRNDKNLLNRYEMRMIRAHALYFLAFFYCRANDHFTAKNKLEDCINIKSNTIIDKLARELLQNLWDNQITLPWWRWWLTATSGIYLYIKRILFFLFIGMIIIILALLVLHPILFSIFSDNETALKPDVYIFTVGLIILLILLPSVEQLKTKDFEVKIHTPKPLEFLPSSAMMEETLKDASGQRR